MRKLFALALVVAFAVTAVPASASRPQGLTIVSHMPTTPGEPGTFVASGPAVDAGAFCPGGSVRDVEGRVTGMRSGRLLNIFVHKLFVCTDGSGSIEMDLNVHVVFSCPPTVAEWRVSGGDGDYVKLHANGKLSSVNLDEHTLQDTYQGSAHIN